MPIERQSWNTAMPKALRNAGVARRWLCCVLREAEMPLNARIEIMTAVEALSRLETEWRSPRSRFAPGHAVELKP